MHKKPYTYTESNQEIIKKIELEKDFANYVAKDMRSKRYGINTYCSVDAYDSTILQKEICDWQNLKKPVLDKSYSNIAWLRPNNAFPDWLQFGTTGQTCMDPCPKYSDPSGSPILLLVDIPLSMVFTGFINESGNAYLIAQASGDGGLVEPWLTVGKAILPTNASSTNLGGGFILNINGQLFFRYHVYADNTSTPVKDGAEYKDDIRFILIDGNKQYQIKFNNTDWPQVNQYNQFPAEGVVPGCALCWEHITIAESLEKALLCDNENPDCWFCGMVPINPENPFGESPGVNFICKDDVECIYLTVNDQYGNPIPDYEIILDGELFGTTDENGLLLFKIPQASINNFHTINDCEFCFYTTGRCNQQKITITINNDAAKAPCSIRKVTLDCKKGETIEATPVTPDTPTDVLTSWVCDEAYYGCIEIVDNDQIYGYPTQIECLENCEPPPPLWRCMTPLTQGDHSVCYCQSYANPNGDQANGYSSFASQEECENCSECCCNPPDSYDTEVWKCVHYTGGCVECQLQTLTTSEPFSWESYPPLGTEPTMWQSYDECYNLVGTNTQGTCDCDDGDDHPSVVYCENGNCIEMSEGEVIPPWIPLQQQYDSLDSCLSLCGPGRREELIEAWEAIGTVSMFNPGCCEQVDDVVSLGPGQYASEAECNEMVFCEPGGGGTEISSDIVGACCSSAFPEDGAYQWLQENYYNLITFNGSPLNYTVNQSSFTSTYYLGNSALPETAVSAAASDWPQYVNNEDLPRFIIFPIYFTQSGLPWVGVDGDGNPYTWLSIQFWLHFDPDNDGVTNLTFNPGLTNFVNTFDFKQAVDPTKLMNNYGDFVWDGCEDSQLGCHGINTGGTVNQTHNIIMNEMSAVDSWVIRLEGAGMYNGQDYPAMFKLGGMIMWVAFNLPNDAGDVENYNFDLTNVTIQAECWEGGCPWGYANMMDCAWGSPFAFQLDPDTTY